ncbi:MAG: sulfite exporter TauE/SafE family protein [Chromatiaceae bacterium]|nr:sulfite exporter TauE/SafE family protein [Chromatiaceae bacterium]
MPLNADTYILVTSLVFVIALVFSMLGLGGGMLYVPVFKWLALPVKTIAVPLSLLLNGVTTASALARYAREGIVDFRGGLPAALTALVAAPIGAQVMQYVPVPTLLAIFAVTTALAGLRSLTTKPPKDSEDTPLSQGRRLAIGIGVGGFEGFMGGLLGVGGGFIVAPILMELGYTPKQAAATTSFIVTFASVSGFLTHAAEGHLEPLLTGLTLLAAIAGSQLGAWLMIRKAKPAWVKRLYGVLLLAVAAKLLHGLLN